MRIILISGEVNEICIFFVEFLVDGILGDFFYRFFEEFFWLGKLDLFIF